MTTKQTSIGQEAIIEIRKIDQTHSCKTAEIKKTATHLKMICNDTGTGKNIAKNIHQGNPLYDGIDDAIKKINKKHKVEVTEIKKTDTRIDIIYNDTATGKTNQKIGGCILEIISGFN